MLADSETGGSLIGKGKKDDTHLGENRRDLENCPPSLDCQPRR